MPKLTEQSRQYSTVARAIEYIRANTRKQPSLAEIADSVNLSEYHLQRIFTQWAGISPKRFLQFLTKEHARQALLQSRDVLCATMESGLSSPGRLHDLLITCEAMTPGAIRARGFGVKLSFGLSHTPFGLAMIAWTSRGICNLAFCDDDGMEAIQALSRQWSGASLLRNDKEAADLLQRIFAAEPRPGKLNLLLRGTNFQIKVWEALLGIGSSQIVSYTTLAQLAGISKAQHSVGSALAANHIAYLIPCHRVIRGTGDIGIYRWGSHRKLALQGWEASKGK